jgi:hypothetical protein
VLIDGSTPAPQETTGDNPQQGFPGFISSI